MKLDLSVDRNPQSVEDFNRLPQQNRENREVAGKPEPQKKVLNDEFVRSDKDIAVLGTRVDCYMFKPTRDLVVKIKENETGKEIKQIPSKKTLLMAVYMRTKAGLAIDVRI